MRRAILIRFLFGNSLSVGPNRPGRSRQKCAPSLIAISADRRERAGRDNWLTTWAVSTAIAVRR